MKNILMFLFDTLDIVTLFKNCTTIELSMVKNVWSFIDFALNTLILNVVLLHSFLFSIIDFAFLLVQQLHCHTNSKMDFH